MKAARRYWYMLVIVVLGATVGFGAGIVQKRTHMARKPPLIPQQQREAAATCLKITDEDKKLSCYEDHLKKILHDKGGEAALAELDRLSKNTPYVLDTCHPMAHAIGHDAYHQYGTVVAATKHGRETCWSGYYHGVMESYMSGFDDTKLAALMPTICKQTPGKPYSFDYYNCLHGLGHGVTIRFDNDIFKGLPYCHLLIGSWEQQSCYGGVFMQNIVVDGVNHKSLNIKTDDPIYPCNVIKQDEKESCYLMVTSQILKYTAYDYPKGFAWCAKADVGFVSTCYQSMGRDVSGNFVLDQRQIMTHCAEGGPGPETDCIIGAVKNDVFNDRNTMKATALCNALEPRLKTPCINAKEEAASTI